MVQRAWRACATYGVQRKSGEGGNVEDALHEVIADRLADVEINVFARVEYVSTV